MKEITRTKRIEVAHYYLLGSTYKEIEEETGISHGSIANIVSELEDGDLNIPKPRVGISQLNIPNAFAFGRTRRDGRVCVTQGILRLLNYYSIIFLLS